MHSLVLAQHVLSRALAFYFVCFHLSCRFVHLHVGSRYEAAVQTQAPPTATAAAWLMCRVLVAEALHSARSDSTMSTHRNLACGQLAPGLLDPHTTARAVLLCCVVQEPEPSECETAPRDGTSDKPLFRLFVGWVPKLFTERDLLPLFQKVRLLGLPAGLCWCLLTAVASSSFARDK